MALQQAEKLWDAGMHASPATSPLLLFYALGQAGRAIAAAKGPKGNGWDPPDGHGLHLQAAGSDLAACRVKPRMRGLVQLVAEVLGSPVLAQPASLAEIAACLPSVGNTIAKDLSPALRPILLHAAFTPGPGLLGLRLLGAPAHTVRPDASQPDGFSANDKDSRRWLEGYPTVGKLGPPTAIRAGEVIYSVEMADTAHSLLVTWDMSDRGPLDFRDLRRFVDLKLPFPPGNPVGWVVPKIGGNEGATSPLIAWWLLLFGLSMLCRYYPEDWGALIDLDTNPWAATLTDILDVGVQWLPDLIYEALTQS